ncbi:WD40/YVTN/BNR-like repeat-containing protein, partial [Bacteroidota bacterium]
LDDCCITTIAINKNDEIFLGVDDFSSRGKIYFINSENIRTKVYTGEEWSGIRDLKINNNGHIFAATIDGLIKSTDNGIRWYKKVNGLKHSVFCVTFLEDNDSLVFAGINENGLFKSKDNGESWLLMESEVSNYNIDILNSYKHDIIFAVNSSGNIVLTSLDKGESWRESNFVLLGSVETLVVNSEGYLFAGGRYGVSRSNDFGISWTKINQGLKDTIIKSLTVTSNGYLYAGTKGGGVYKSINPTTSIDFNIKACSKVHWIANSTLSREISIYYSLEQPSFVNIDIYNSLGNKIANIVNEYQEAGEQSVIFDGSNFPAGVYFYIVRIGEKIESGKLMLVR